MIRVLPRRPAASQRSVEAALPRDSARSGVLALLCLVFLSGCVSEMVQKRKPRKGPVKEVGYIDTGGGELRYSTEGWGWFVAGRRRDALRRMRRVCKKLKPVVTDEFTREDVDVPYSNEDINQNLDRGLDHYTVAPFTHLVFECSSSTGTAPSPLLVPAVSTATASVEPSTAPLSVPLTSTGAAALPVEPAAPSGGGERLPSGDGGPMPAAISTTTSQENKP